MSFERPENVYSLGDAAAAALAEALEAPGCPLEHLWLTGKERIMDDGGYARLGRALETNTTLSFLYLRASAVGEARKAALTARHGKRVTSQW